ncbi:MAG: protein ImuB [Solirubrobacteraceae bacterium]|jgi:protein ImuB|nr:protein ImuB [Solirubrobacteraceae bacterium]
MIVCVLLPRFELAVAAGGLQSLVGRPVALAPDASAPTGRAGIGEVSGAAQAVGLRPGMGLGEALTRCPGLELVAGDPVAVTAAWERSLQALEGIGAAVESQRPGLACFDAAGLRGLHGGSEELVIVAARRALGTPARLGGAPTRFCALAAALATRPRRTTIVRGAAGDHLRNLPVSLLRSRPRTAPLVQMLERLGISTLGELAAMTPAALTDRFGAAGAEAHRLARGEDDPPTPRRPVELLAESLELHESASGQALEHALGVLIDRLLARPERRGRTLRGATLTARLVDAQGSNGGGSWQVPVTFRESTADPQRMRLALTPRLTLLPAPALALGLAAGRLGPPTGDQRALLSEPIELRRERLREAVRQARVAGGPNAALRVVAVDSASRIPERRMMLAPFES